MAFLRCIALLAAVSAALALEDCTDASCAIKAQQLLQKSKTKRALKVKSAKERNIQHMDLDNYKVLESFVDLLALQSDPLSQEQMEIISELNKTFYEETLPTLYERHQNDELLLQQHADAVATCNTNLETGEAAVKGLKDASDTAAATEADCKATEEALMAAKEQAMAMMTEFLESSVPSCGSIPEPRQPTPEMDAWIMCNLGFYNSFNASYYSYKAVAMAAESAYEAMSTNCSILSSSSDEKLCSWVHELSLVKSDYEHCRSETVTLFEETLDSTQDNTQGRKSDYSALVKIQCYLQVLMGGDISAAANIHTMCDSAATDTHMFDITVPDLVPYASHILEHMGTPPAGSCDTAEDESAYESPYEESSY